MSYYRFSYSPLTAGKHKVGLTGDFTSWEIIPLKEVGGIYTLNIDLPPGVYQ